MLIPAGTFTMGGSDSDETGHQLTISWPFYMQTTEVMQRQWKRVMGNNPFHFRRCGDDCLVEQVSWNNVQEVIHKLNQLEGNPNDHYS
jgi:formylglycine-generating enzyme required for sulfatase activity